jgi:uncharacterized protein
MKNNMTDPERLLQMIIRLLVNSPDEVRVVSTSDNNSTIFQVSVAPNEAGQIIGKQGRTARSLRTLLSSMGVAAKTRYSLDILDHRTPITPTNEAKELVAR